MHDSLLRQRSALLLHIKFSHPQSPQHLQTAGVSAVGGQCQLHLQQTLQERVDGLRLKGFHNDVTCVRKRKALTLSAASLTEKHEDSKASSRTSISGCSASAHPSCPPALVHRAVRQPAASTYNTHTLHHNSPQTPCVSECWSGWESLPEGEGWTCRSLWSRAAAYWLWAAALGRSGQTGKKRLSTNCRDFSYISLKGVAHRTSSAASRSATSRTTRGIAHQTSTIYTNKWPEVCCNGCVLVNSVGCNRRQWM